LIKKWKGPTGQDITEEQVTDPDGNVKSVRTIKRIDFNGKEEIETISLDENGDEIIHK